MEFYDCLMIHLLDLILLICKMFLSIEVQKDLVQLMLLFNWWVIQLITKSVFAEDKNSVKVGIGDDGPKEFQCKIKR